MHIYRSMPPASESSLISRAKFSAFGATTLAHFVLFRFSCCYWQMFLLQLRKLFNSSSSSTAERGASVCVCEFETTREQASEQSRSEGEWAHTGRERMLFWFIEWPINLLLGGGCEGVRDDGCSCRLGTASASAAASVSASVICFCCCCRCCCWRSKFSIS